MMGKVQRFIEIMGDEKDRCPHAVQQFPKHILHFGPGERIKRAKRLVHEKNFRLCSKSARQSDTLPLPSGQLMRIAMRERGGIKPDELKQFTRPIAALRLGAPLDFEQNTDISFNGEVGKKAGLLNDVSHFAPQSHHILLRFAGDQYIA